MHRGGTEKSGTLPDTDGSPRRRRSSSGADRHASSSPPAALAGGSSGFSGATAAAAAAAAAHQRTSLSQRMRRLAVALCRCVISPFLRAFDALVCQSLPDPRLKLRRIHGARFQSWLTRAGDALFASTAGWRIALLGAACLYLLCFLPLLMPPATSATLAPSLRQHGSGAGRSNSDGGSGSGFPSAAAQRRFDPAEYALMQAGSSRDLSAQSFDSVFEGPMLSLHPKAQPTEAALEADYYFGLQTPPVGWWDGWASERVWDSAPQFQFTRSTVDGIALAYQKIGEVRPEATERAQVLRAIREKKEEQTRNVDIRSRAQLDALDKALAKSNRGFADQLAATPSLYTTLPAAASSFNASFAYEWEHNRESYVEIQHTIRAWDLIPNTRRLKLVRDYSRFPSSVPSFLSVEPLEAKYLDRDTLNPPLGNHQDLPIPPPSKLYQPERILLLYVFAYNHDEYMQNMETFISRVVRPHQAIDYVFLINQLEGREVELERLPPLPPNGRYIAHKNECYDWGTVGWIIDLQSELARDHAATGGYTLHANQSKYHLDLPRYKHFIIMNSSVRGPWFPSYIDLDDPRNMWWEPFLYMKQRDTQVKMVGCLINCQISPHVQSYVLLLDQETFTILQGHSSEKLSPEATAAAAAAAVADAERHSVWSALFGALPRPFSSAPSSSFATLDNPVPVSSAVFHCHDSWSDAVNKAEVGASFTILQKGFNLGSLFRAYSGIDFRSPYNQECVGSEHNPSEEVLTGPLITSGPDAAYVQQQISVLIARQNQLMQQRLEEEDEHDLEGDILTPEEVARRATVAARLADSMDPLSDDEVQDWDWVAHRRDGIPSEQGGPPTRNRNLDMALRILAAARTKVVEASVRKIAAQYYEAARASNKHTAKEEEEDELELTDDETSLTEFLASSSSSSSSSSPSSPSPALVFPLLPPSMRPRRPRPDELLVGGLDAESGSAASADAAALAAQMVDLEFLYALAEDVLAYQRRYGSIDEAEKSVQAEEGRLRQHVGVDSRFHSSSPLSPSLHRSKLQDAQHTLHMRPMFVDPLEVMFGKWKTGLSMRHSPSYNQFFEAARERRLHNRHRLVQKRVHQWNAKNQHRWNKHSELWQQRKEAEERRLNKPVTAKPLTASEVATMAKISSPTHWLKLKDVVHL